MTYSHKLTRLKSANARRTAARAREAYDFRLALCMELSRCEYCGKNVPFNRLVVNEIARGPFRQLALDKAFAVQVVCADPCHRLAELEPKERQLARLKISRPLDYDLDAYHALIRRRHPDAEAVELEVGRMSK